MVQPATELRWTAPFWAGDSEARGATQAYNRVGSREVAARLKTGEEPGTGEDQTELLALVDVLGPLSQDELEDFASRAPDIQLESGEEHFRLKEYDGGLLLIKRGRVRVYKLTSGGRQYTVALLGEGRAFPIWESPELHIQAMETSAVSFMRREVLERLVRKSPEMGLRLVRLLSYHLRRSEERMCEMVYKDVLSRLASAILRLIRDEGIVTREGYKIPIHYTHDQLGTIIGANRVAVTKAFCILQDLGAVELKRRLIHIPDMEALRRLASKEKELTHTSESTSRDGSR